MKKVPKYPKQEAAFFSLPNGTKRALIRNNFHFASLLTNMTPHNCEIVDCGAFCEVIFFCISPKNLLGDFFDSLAEA